MYVEKRYYFSIFQKNTNLKKIDYGYAVQQNRKKCRTVYTSCKENNPNIQFTMVHPEATLTTTI